MSSPLGRRHQSVTRDDVARLAGVSSAVVSYTLNGGPRPVAAATRQRVLAAVEKLGYRPNATARSLSLGRADLIGLVVPELRNPYFAQLGHAVEIAARRRGLSVVLMHSSNDTRAADTEDADAGIDDSRILDTLSGRLLSGVIVATQPSSEMSRELIANGAPVVLINQPRASGVLPTLAPDYYHGTVEAVRHLIDVHGHREIAFFGGHGVADDRERGWRDALVAAGIVPRVNIDAVYSLAGGRDAGRELLRDHPGASAVFAASDQQAAGLLAALHERNLRCPDDLAVVSFDGSPESEYAVPPLTTVSVPIEQMARDAVDRLLVAESSEHVEYATHLVVRESCGCAYTPTVAEYPG